MARTLTDGILDAHAGGTAGASLALRPDHVVAAGDDAPLALAAFATVAAGAARPDLALVVGDSRTALESLGVGVLPAAAVAAGAIFSPPSLGHAARVHVERFAAPGRLAIACGASLAASGGLGCLALEADALAVAAGWCGAAHPLDRPRVVRVAIEGAFAPALGAPDLMFALAASPRAATLRGCVIEFGGPGMGGVPVEERILSAAMADVLGAIAVLWPADDRTRAWMAAHGRESDWKRLAVDEDAPFDRAVDIAGLEPQLAPPGDAALARPLRDEGVRAVDAVVIGPAAPPAAALLLARALRDRALPSGAMVCVLPGSRAIAAGLAADPLSAKLATTMVNVSGPGGGSAMAPAAASDALGLCVGIDASDLPGPAARWRSASMATCVASALAGRLEDARGAAWLAVDRDAVMPSTADGLITAAAATGEDVADPRPRPLPLPPVPEESLRAQVLARLGDDVTSDQVLRWGPRVRDGLADVAAMAAHVLDDVEPGFAARARQAGGGLVIAGERCGGGPRSEVAALALAALGVRAVLARSFAPAFARHLARAGVLPLTFLEGDGQPMAGDELEIPALAEGLAAGRALAVRDLTGGFGCTVRLELEARDATTARAGGLLRALRASDPPAPGKRATRRKGRVAERPRED